MDADFLRGAIERSVLCWLATSDADGQPNVSPKEVFRLGPDGTEILIAEIASPVSRRNIAANPRVCVSLLDVFSQKGAKVYGNADVIDAADDRFLPLATPLLAMAPPPFKIRGVIRVTVTKAAPIMAPSYALYPERTEAEQRQRAYEAYGVSEA
jgi:predicted pyridoxine 5'-phosphate oxidase superfamily flavin-nucleotide-binding protein